MATIRENFEKAMGVFAERGDTEMVEFFEGRIAQLDKKNSAERKPTAKQVENVGIKSEIVAFLDGKEPMTAADVAKNCPALVDGGIKPQRVAALLGQLVKSGEVVKTEDKRKSFYSLA